jgi:hypothetical protein
MAVDNLLRSISDGRAAFALARHTYARRLAPDFDLFDFIDPGEVKLSSILAWMLDPGGSHGQGSLYLAEFVRELDLDWRVDDAARVAVEVRTDEGRRVDVVVRLPPGVIGIENKPFDVDRPNQIADYLAWLDAQSGRRCLVYLAGAEGAIPWVGSIAEDERRRREAEGEFKAISYPTLLPWLGRCRAATEAHSVSAFLDAFSRYIRRKFTGAMDMTERVRLVETALRSPENLRSAMQLIAAAGAVRSAVMNTFAEGVRAALPPGYSLTSFDASDARYTGLRIAMPGVTGLDFAVSFEGSGYHWLIYGVRRRGEEPFEPGTKGLLDAAVGPGTPTVTWPWYRRASLDDRTFPVTGDWRLAEEPWIESSDGRLARKVADAATAVRNALKSGAAETDQVTAASS